MELIEDPGGVPLPPELQRDSPLYNAMKEISLYNGASSIDEFVEKAMVVIAPFWPAVNDPVKPKITRIVCEVTGRTWPTAKAVDIKTCVGCQRKIDTRHESWVGVPNGPMCEVCCPIPQRGSGT